MTVPSSLSVSTPDLPTLPPDVGVRTATRDDLELAASFGGVRPNLPETWEDRTRRPTQRGYAGIGPNHFLYGVLQDARDPLGSQLSRRNRRELGCLGFISSRPNPVRLPLQAHGIELSRLA